MPKPLKNVTSKIWVNSQEWEKTFKTPSTNFKGNKKLFTTQTSNGGIRSRGRTSTSTENEWIINYGSSVSRLTLPWRSLFQKETACQNTEFSVSVRSHSISSEYAHLPNRFPDPALLLVTTQYISAHRSECCPSNAPIKQVHSQPQLEGQLFTFRIKILHMVIACDKVLHLRYGIPIALLCLSRLDQL